jgi:hypothetical protein
MKKKMPPNKQEKNTEKNEHQKKNQNQNTQKYSKQGYAGESKELTRELIAAGYGDRKPRRIGSQARDFIRKKRSEKMVTSQRGGGWGVLQKRGFYP